MGKFITKRDLHAGEGLTIAFGWDKDLIAPPSSWKRFWWKMNPSENGVFLFPILSFLYMANLWYRKEREPRVRESVTVMYEPPKFSNTPLTPAEVGTLIDERLDPSDITSTIIGLAIKGYIKIEEIKKEGHIFDKTDYSLKKIKAKDPSLNPFETELMKALFPDPLPDTLVSDLKNKFYIHLDLLKKTFYGELIRKKYFITSPDKVRNSYVIAGIVVLVFATLSFIFFVPHSIGKDIIAGLFTAIIGFRTFNPYLFIHSVNLVTSNLGSTLFSAPRGSGGNGRSGSGFDGGGSPEVVLEVAVGGVGRITFQA